jgi:hypothetical protein
LIRAEETPGLSDSRIAALLAEKLPSLPPRLMPMDINLPAHIPHHDGPDYFLYANCSQ